MRKKLPVFLFISILALAVFFRAYKITENPPGLYWEEVALGYDAYSLLKTGADHHGNVLPLVALESFGDWKPALYAYTIIPFIWLFDLTALAVRLPSLLAGSSIVICSYFFAKRLGQNPLIAMGVTAIAPWAIHFSRAGWESHLATAFLLWGLYFGMCSIQKKIPVIRAMISVVLFGLALYTYHAARITVPLIALGLLVYVVVKMRRKITFKDFISKNLSTVTGLFVATALFVLPFLQNLNSPVLVQRGKETSIFTDITVIEESNQLRENSGDSLLSRILYHRYVLFGKEILKNYSSHFNLDFLFVSGDAQPRHATQFFGHLYHIELIFLLFGFVAWYQKRSGERLLLLFWLMISIIPGSITKASPHALRMLAGFPIFALLIAGGIEYLHREYKMWLGKSHKRFLPLFLLAVIGAYLLELTAFWQHYSKIYPVVHAKEWQVGYPEMIGKLAEKMREYPDLPAFVSRDMGRPAMYYWFYTKTDPKLVQAANDTAEKDQGEFLEFGRIRFVRGLELSIGQRGIFSRVVDGNWSVMDFE
ncbi:MAG: hypothetical protein COU67_00810 [Candidatus Pacebacteria bacterium CG10_big_fil_rev_8_21_14_0_10_44_54]|nr:hypothetical protein [Candidatus Paceibacterota bacterium]PIR60810.1 MAG: hypothetical protein COU67_00810 [Candidatus Pacebacteria bacterium CG10_big_fil_rev_8_21_14_0_10_44_54]